MSLNPTRTLTRLCAATGGIAVILTAGAFPAAAADGDVEVINTETVQAYTDATGEVQGDPKLYEQLALTGDGAVELANPVETSGLRNLNGFSGLNVEDGDQMVDVEVDGQNDLRSVSSYDEDLPLSISVDYVLDGESISPEDLVGESGDLEVTYTIQNVTSQLQTISYTDGKGGTIEEQAEVMMPMVGSLTTTLPSTFREVDGNGANAAGDGKGGTKLSYTMTLLAPLAEDTVELGYSAEVVDAVAPDASVSALPVNPLDNPTLSNAAKSYKGGAETGEKLAAGASTIDSNLLKLRDGASDLLAGLIKLRDGADKLSTGLQEEAAPGARKLADGAGRLADGTGKAEAGAGQLTDGLGQISDGLDQLSGVEGLQAAQGGIQRLREGVATIRAGFGAVGQEGTLIDGLTRLASGLRDARDGQIQVVGGLEALVAAPPAEGLPLIKLGLDGAVGPGGSLDQLVGGLEQLKNFCAPLPSPTKEQCIGTINFIIANVNGEGGSRDKLQAAANGLGTAITKIEGLLLPGATKIRDGLIEAAPGAEKARVGAIKLAGGVDKVSAGLGELSAGVTRAVDGALKLADGADKAYAGSQELTGGLGQLDDGAGQLDDGAGRLADGLVDAADGSGLLADGLGTAAGGAPKLVDGAQRLSDEGTKKLVAAGEQTAQEYGKQYALIMAGAELAQDGKMIVGAPEESIGLAAYTYEVQGEDGESNRNLAKAVGGLALLAAGGGLFLLRRRFV
jgi:putative membrane protein